MSTMKLFIAACLLVVLPLAANAFPPDKTGNCLDCHKLERKEAEDLVKKLIPGGVVLDIKLAPVKAFWQIEVEANGRRGGVYLDFTKKYVAQIAPLESVLPKKADFSKLPLKDAVVMGAKNPKKKVAVFTDPDCPYCRKLHEELKRIIATRQDIAFYMFLYPLPMHKDAYKKSQAVLCEKSPQLLDEALSGKAMPEPKCGNEQLEKILALGKEMGVSGTPALIREDGTILSGFLPADKLADWIDGK